jgi:uncharacterized protein (DUF433 family)
MDAALFSGRVRSCYMTSMPQYHDLIDRITFNPQICGGRPCVRGMRIRASDILEMLSLGISQETILADFPDLEAADIAACLKFAAKRVDVPRVAA